jgi:hypothetical protein
MPCQHRMIRPIRTPRKDQAYSTQITAGLNSFVTKSERATIECQVDSPDRDHILLLAPEIEAKVLHADPYGVGGKETGWAQIA